MLTIGVGLGIDSEYLSLPGFKEIPAIEAPATPDPEPDVEVNVTVHDDRDAAVVDGEIVEDDPH
ncbi:hypothetical protein [Nocardioides lianchengensis]|uniref:hypothetical protein n=1 Tax=Nocardioides lianchengensis TaxID=1045774 RepID=UPI000B81217F|nr:hypothetical protein [Nocardioides lianchengensis]NYG08770.1 hypothetical protein [Nocardioides lianchengensis]